MNTPYKKSQISILIIAIISLLALAAVFAYVVNRNQVDESSSEVKPLVIDRPIIDDATDSYLDLVAENEASDGVAPDSTFHLSTSLNISAEQLRDSLNFKPKIAYAIDEVDSGEFLITPESSLDSGSIVTAEIELENTVDGRTDRQTASWAYQVREEFQVVSTLPRDKSDRVAVDAGIEIEFSHSNLKNINDVFTISPYVDGKFEYHRKTVVFVPNEFLEPETLYTITIAQSYQSVSGKQLPGEYVFQFETDTTDERRGSEPGITQVNQVTNETSSQEPAYFIVSGTQLDQIETVKMRIFELSPNRYQEEFANYNSIPRWSYYSPDHWRIDTSDLTLHAEEEVQLQNIGGRYQYAVSTPGPLEIGQYYIEIDGQPGKTVSALLQVSDMSAYLTTSKTDTIAWVHDAITKQPLVGAVISAFGGDQLGTTQESGILQVSTPEALKDEAVNQVVSIEHQGKQLFIPLIGNAYGDFERYYHNGSGTAASDFWSYIYLDQPFYQPNSSMRYWGVLDPREGYEHGKVTFSIYQSLPTNKKLVLTNDVTFGEFNTFEGSVELSGIRPGDYYAVVENDGEIAFQRYFSVLTYTKPAYTINVVPELIGVMSGDEYTHNITATFFDDTPVTYTDFNIGNEIHRTNEEGKIIYTRQYLADDCKGTGYYCYESVHVVPTLGEESRISGFGELRVFKANRMVNAKLNHTTSGQALLSGVLYSLDLEGFNAGAYERYEDPYGNIIGNEDIEIVVSRNWYTKEQTGTRYDFADKRTVPQYNYTRHTEEISRNTIRTGQDGSFTRAIDLPESDSWYDVDVNVTDESGRKVSYSYGIAGKDYGAQYRYDEFYLGFDEESDDSVTLIGQFSVGDTVTTNMRYGDEQLESEKESFLFLQAQNGIREIALRDDAQYSFTFEEADIPNVNVQGIWYDGRSYWSTSSAIGPFSSGLVASFNEEDRKMDIVTTLDKEAYRPGDEVVMDIQVSRPDGSATQSVVNVNLIDEAIYAILPSGGMDWSANYQANFFTVLYTNVASGIYSAYASHRYPLSISGAEGGGGWGTRTDFPDQAFYQTVTTDETGHARLSFTLPDSITSWRVNVHAIDGERYASNNFSNLIVTQPFFVTAVLNDEYLVGDQPIMKVRAFGDDVQSDMPITITVSSHSLGMETQQFMVQGNETANVILPVMTEGAHEIEITAEGGEHGDTIIREFVGRRSFMAIGQVEEYDVGVGWQPPKTETSAHVVFTDKYKAQAYQRLYNYRNNYGDRVDTQAARTIATQLLNDYFETGLNEPAFVPAQYQLADTGGVSILPYSDDDLTVSAHLAASHLSDEFDQSSLREYFSAIVNDTTQTSLRHAQSLYGLAAMQQPVLLDIQDMARRDDITDVDRLYLAAALVELGDFAGGKALYKTILDVYGEQVEDYWYLTLGVDEHEQLENTLLASYVATILQQPEADSLYSYVYRNKSPEIVLDIIAVNTIEQRLKHLPKIESVITYSRAGKEYQHIFEEGKSHQLVVLPTDQLEVNEVVGDIKAIVSYEAEPLTEELNTSQSMSVDRRYETTTLNEQELVKVYVNTTLNEDLPDYDQRYQVTDIIPAGMRLVTSLGDHNDFQNSSEVKRPYHIDGQRVSFYVSSHDTNFEYYLRPIQKGTFGVEPPVIQSYYFPHLSNSGSRDTIVIQ